MEPRHQASGQTRVESELLNALRSAELTTRPWPHAWIPTTFSKAIADRLTEEFPASGLPRYAQLPQRGPLYKQMGPVQTFRVATAPFNAASEYCVGIYRDLFNAINGPPYREAIAALTQIDLRAGMLDLDIWEYGQGDYLGPHVDKPDTLVTHIIYLSNDWQPAHGGKLQILDGATQPGRIVYSYEPTQASSAVLVRSDRSWHQVEAVATNNHPRRLLTAAFILHPDAPSD